MEAKQDAPRAPDEKILHLLRFWGQRHISNRFKEFFKEHADVFDDDCRDAEQRLEYTACYEKYTALYEELLGQFLSSHDIAKDDFVDRCRAAMDCGGASIDTQILKAILAGTDYLAFLRMISDYKAMEAQTDAIFTGAKTGGDVTPPTAPGTPRDAKEDDAKESGHARGNGGAKGAK